MLAKEYLLLLQILSHPNHPDVLQRITIWHNLGTILQHIVHLLSLLHEHQAKHQLIAHLKQQTILNRHKALTLRQCTHEVKQQLHCLATRSITSEPSSCPESLSTQLEDK